MAAIFGSRAATKPEYDFKEELAQGNTVIMALAENESQAETAVEIANDLNTNLVNRYDLKNEEADSLPQ